MKTLATLIAGLAVGFGLVAGAGPAVAAGGDSGSPAPRITELTQARAAIDKKDFNAALPLLRAAVTKAPDSADAWNLLGYAHRKLGMKEKAFEYYQKALTIDKEHRGALEYLGELYLESGRPEEAKRMPRRLDDACLLGCAEYDDLKKALRAAKVID